MKNSSLKKLEFEIDVAATREKAFNTMIGKDTYPFWTKPFNPSSRFIGDWSENSKMLFVGEDDKGNTGGMVSRIVANRPYELISIAHQGMLDGDKEITDSEEVAEWAGAHENYFFSTVGDKTRIAVEMDVLESHEAFFRETWPKALSELKTLCES